MIQLSDIPHDTNFAHISITRLGDSRNTDYQVSPSEARLESEERTAAPLLTGEDLRNNFERWKHGNFIEQ